MCCTVRKVTTMMPAMADIWSRVAANTTVTSSGCWLWTAKTGKMGVPHMKVHSKTSMVRRVVWEHERGPIPPGMYLYSACSNLCVNPSHAQVVSRADVARLAQRMDLQTRFWGSVARTDGPGCWLWTGAASAGGYGVTSIGRKQVMAHRLALELSSGESIPPGKLVCHHCDVRLCCRPDHLYVGDTASNARDRQSRDRGATAERAWNAKLTWAAVKDIRARRANGETLTSLVAAFGVCKSVVSSVVNNKTWVER